MKNKNLIMGVLVVAGVGILYYMWKKKQDTQQLNKQASNKSASNQPQTNAVQTQDSIKGTPTVAGTGAEEE